MWIALPSAKESVNEPPVTGSERPSLRTVALASPTQGSENLPLTPDPAEPANTKKCPFAHLTIAVVPGPCDHPEVTVGAFRTKARSAIRRFVSLTAARIAA